MDFRTIIMALKLVDEYSLKKIMKQDIVEKLDRHFSEGIKREADVVYTLVELRKLLDQKVSAKDYPVIRFYANWVVHTNLSHPNDVLEGFLRHIDFAMMLNKVGTAAAVKRWVYRAISVRQLQVELWDFSRSLGLDSKIFHDSQWPNFLRNLVPILIDTPLIPPKGTDFKFIKQFSFFDKKRYHKYKDDEKVIACWKIERASGNSFLVGPIYLNSVRMPAHKLIDLLKEKDLI